MKDLFDVTFARMAAEQEATNDLFALAEELGIEVSVINLLDFFINYAAISNYANYAKVNYYCGIFDLIYYMNNVISVV